MVVSQPATTGSTRCRRYAAPLRWSIHLEITCAAFSPGPLGNVLHFGSLVPQICLEEHRSEPPRAGLPVRHESKGFTERGRQWFGVIPCRQPEFPLQSIRTCKDDGAQGKVWTCGAIADTKFEVELPGHVILALGGAHGA